MEVVMKVVRVLYTSIALALLATTVEAQLIRQAAGTNAVAITPARDQFRMDLGGGIVAGGNGLFSDATGARREVNWDGVPAAQSSPNAFPGNFFQSRGSLYSTPGTGFQVSNADFTNIDPSYASLFEAFSPARLFSPIGSNVTDVIFTIPGTPTPALTRGFGSVFSDVDMAGATQMQFFGAANNLLGTFLVPNVPSTETMLANQTFSFLGVSFPSPVVSRVRITTGTGPLDLGNVNFDVAVMDDFLYAEPVPEPSTYAMMVAGLLATGLLIRRRGRARGTISS
jgi:hypothetical protein